MTEQPQTPSRARKIIQFPLTRIVLGAIWIMLAVVAAQLLVRLLPGQESLPVVVLSSVLIAFIVAFAYYVFVRVVERRPVTELSASGAIAELATGMLVGTLLFTVVVGILWLLGYYKVTGINNWAVIVPLFAASVLAGVIEEIMFRGILFRIVEEGLGTWLALLFSALVFGLLHLGNQNATLWAGIAIAIEAGILLGAAFAVTRRLWLAIGVHFAWNFTQSGIFSIAGSGYEANGLLQATLSGPDILSGGAFGAEASIFALIVCTSAGVYFTWLALKKGKFVKPFWKRRSPI